MPVAAIGAAVASVGGAALSSSATKKASKKAVSAQVAMNEQNNALIRENRDMLSAKVDPYVQSGNRATEALNALLGLSGDATTQQAAFDTYRDNTGYQFRMNEGLRALASNYRARGVSQSGAASKGEMRYGQDYGSNEFWKYANGLSGQASTGLQGVGVLSGVTTNATNAMTAGNSNVANAQSNAALVNGAANNSLYGTAANALGGLFGQMGSSYQSNPFGNQRNPYGISGGPLY